VSSFLTAHQHYIGPFIAIHDNSRSDPSEQVGFNVCMRMEMH